MKYCSNCGAEVNENAAVCVKCGYALKSNDVTINNAQPQSSKASMVLGILAVIFGAIALFLVIAVQSYLTNTYDGRIQRLATNFESTRLGLMILFIPVPGILSVIGFILGLTNKVKGGAKTAGIVLNAIALVLCIIMILIIQGL